MKNLVIRMVFGLTLLLALGVAFGGATSTSAHAATASQAVSVTPAIFRTACNETHYFEVWTDFHQDRLCFANAGTIAVKLYNVDMVCTGNNTGSIVWHNDGSPSNVWTSFPNRNTCNWIDGGRYVNQVLSITIN